MTTFSGGIMEFLSEVFGIAAISDQFSQETNMGVFPCDAIRRLPKRGYSCKQALLASGWGAEKVKYVIHMQLSHR